MSTKKSDDRGGVGGATGNLMADRVEVMTIPEVAKYLRLSEATVYRYAKQGKIPAFRIGRTWRFMREMIDAWLRQETENQHMTLVSEIGEGRLAQ